MYKTRPSVLKYLLGVKKLTALKVYAVILINLGKVLVELAWKTVKKSVCVYSQAKCLGNTSVMTQCRGLQTDITVNMV